MNIAPYACIVRTGDAGLSERLAATLDRWMHASGATRLIDTDQLTVIGIGSAPHLLLPGGAGLIWGTIFDRVTSWRITAAEIGEIPEESMELVDRFWGGFLSVRQRGFGVEVFRDPSGAAPCYVSRIGEAWVFASSASLLFDLGVERLELDWTVVTQALVFQDLRPTRTALRGIDELMPGTAITITGEGHQLRTLWTPWGASAPDREIASQEEAIERVRRETLNCIGAWTRCYNRPLLELSGGLDSSIIAAVFAQTGAQPLCVTYAAAAGDPDETPYARSVAKAFGFRLEVLEPDIAQVDVTQSAARDLPRPCARAFSMGHDIGLPNGVDAIPAGRQSLAALVTK